MMGRAAVAIVVVALSLAGTAIASGSVSARLEPFSVRLELNLEQEVAQAYGATIYAGSGFVVTPARIERLTPYVLACWELDVLIAYAEACAEARAPLVGGGWGEVVRVFVSVVW